MNFKIVSATYLRFEDGKHILSFKNKTYKIKEDYVRNRNEFVEVYFDELNDVIIGEKFNYNWILSSAFLSKSINKIEEHYFINYYNKNFTINIHEDIYSLIQNNHAKKFTIYSGIDDNLTLLVINDDNIFFQYLKVYESKDVVINNNVIYFKINNENYTAELFSQIDRKLKNIEFKYLGFDGISSKFIPHHKNHTQLLGISKNWLVVDKLSYYPYCKVHLDGSDQYRFIHSRFLNNINSNESFNLIIYIDNVQKFKFYPYQFNSALELNNAKFEYILNDLKKYDLSAYKIVQKETRNYILIFVLKHYISRRDRDLKLSFKLASYLLYYTEIVLFNLELFPKNINGGIFDEVLNKINEFEIFLKNIIAVQNKFKSKKPILSSEVKFLDYIDFNTTRVVSNVKALFDLGLNHLITDRLLYSYLTKSFDSLINGDLKVFNVENKKFFLRSCQFLLDKVAKSNDIIGDKINKVLSFLNADIIVNYYDFLIDLYQPSLDHEFFEVVDIFSRSYVLTYSRNRGFVFFKFSKSNVSFRLGDVFEWKSELEDIKDYYFYTSNRRLEELVNFKYKVELVRLTKSDGKFYFSVQDKVYSYDGHLYNPLNEHFIIRLDCSTDSIDKLSEISNNLELKRFNYSYSFLLLLNISFEYYVINKIDDISHNGIYKLSLFYGQRRHVRSYFVKNISALIEVNNLIDEMIFTGKNLLSEIGRICLDVSSEMNLNSHSIPDDFKKTNYLINLLSFLCNQRIFEGAIISKFFLSNDDYYVNINRLIHAIYSIDGYYSGPRKMALMEALLGELKYFIGIEYYNFLDERVSNVLTRIREGEHLKLEFKSSIWTPVGRSKEITDLEKKLLEPTLQEGAKIGIRSRIKSIQAQIPEELKLAIMKSICAFANTEGGTLLVGIDDNGKAIGINSEIAEFGDDDKFQRHLRDLYLKYFKDQSFVLAIKDYLIRFNDKIVLQVEVPFWKDGVIVHKGEEQLYFIRDGNRTLSKGLGEVLRIRNSKL